MFVRPSNEIVCSLLHEGHTAYAELPALLLECSWVPRFAGLVSLPSPTSRISAHPSTGTRGTRKPYLSAVTRSGTFTKAVNSIPIGYLALMRLSRVVVHSFHANVSIIRLETRFHSDIGTIS